MSQCQTPQDTSRILGLDRSELFCLHSFNVVADRCISIIEGRKLFGSSKSTKQLADV